MPRQGDVLLIPATLPPGQDCNRVLSKGGRHILALGEKSGHHHSVAATPDVARYRPDDAGGVRQGYLVVEREPVLLEHQEHPPLTVRPGTYEVRQQRTYTPAAPQPHSD